MKTGKTKLTVYVPAPVARALKIAAADAGLSQGDLVAATLRAALMAEDGPSLVARTAMKTGPGAALNVARELREDGNALVDIAHHLNRNGFRTATGKTWNVTSVSRLLSR